RTTLAERYMSRKSAVPKVTATIEEYRDRYLTEFLQKIPKESIQGFRFKVYQRRAGRNGGTIDCYLDMLDYDPDGDLENIVREKFVGSHGGGDYVLHLYDALRNRVEEMPKVMLSFPGGPHDQTQATASAMADATVPMVLQQKKALELLSLQQQTAFMERQIAKLSAGDGDNKDPLKLAMAEMLRAQVAGGPKEKVTSVEDLLKLKMVMKAFEDDKPPPQSSHMEKLLETMATGFGALMQSSMAMQQNQMASMQTIMSQSMGMLQQVQTLGQQDPIITALTMAPDILDRLFGGVVNSIKEYKEAKIEVTAAEAAHGLTRAGQSRASLPPPSGVQPKPQGNGAPKTGNEFLRVVYDSFKHSVPADVAADSVQYYLTDEQLHGVLSAPPEEVVGVIERSGLKKFFDQDPKLKNYVLGVVKALQAVYAHAADEKKAAEVEKVGATK
ncbi:MAG: hypothetical protein ACREDF_09695, partial [Thermoplasmata archaeon]